MGSLYVDSFGLGGATYHSMLGWQHDLGFIIRVHGQEVNSYQRRSRGKRLRDLQLRRQEKLLYICKNLFMIF